MALTASGPIATRASTAALRSPMLTVSSSAATSDATTSSRCSSPGATRVASLRTRQSSSPSAQQQQLGRLATPDLGDLPHRDPASLGLALLQEPADGGRGLVHVAIPFGRSRRYGGRSDAALGGERLGEVAQTRSVEDEDQRAVVVGHAGDAAEVVAAAEQGRRTRSAPPVPKTSVTASTISAAGRPATSTTIHFDLRVPVGRREAEAGAQIDDGDDLAAVVRHADDLAGRVRERDDLEGVRDLLHAGDRHRVVRRLRR